MTTPSIVDALPPSLKLPAHLSAHKYFFVCTLTVAAWDTLVLSPRTWRLLRTKEWPPLKIIYHFLRVFMPIEFTIVGVAFFDTRFSQAQCRHFYLFEPICTAILLALCSVVHVIRINAIYEKNRNVLVGMGALLAAQIVVTAICCGFYRSVPLDIGQGCIAGPKHNWVGIYWLSATVLYTASFALAVARSLNSLKLKPLSPWKLMLRDGLNLYAAIWIVNMVNMLFWFIMKPTDTHDPVKTIVTSMAAVLTTSMTLRIILGVRGSLVDGGSFAGSHSSATGSSRDATTHVISSRSTPAAGQFQIGSRGVGQTYTIEDMRGVAAKGEEWTDPALDGKSSVHDTKEAGFPPIESENQGVKITINQEVDVEYDNAPYHGARK
ncbi:hypothetical protein NEOLEDRAFT_1165386 [Neolentinus lepideus HHB14362 ss-1]|uniref:Uncharacterized protein n=1 Tax=Neolentinus lepideus HHB14362 ss-1 TaxID=1314782 RepID=A0A165NEP5_9AGAM|nr:hypothetical protein NEOLEDRAFT_1165386 [Neolentinus lepideus HHB14362 ss-1]